MHASGRVITVAKQPILYSLCAFLVMVLAVLQSQLESSKENGQSFFVENIQDVSGKDVLNNHPSFGYFQFQTASQNQTKSQQHHDTTDILLGFRCTRGWPILKYVN